MIAQGWEIIVGNLLVEKSIHLGRPHKHRERFMNLGQSDISHGGFFNNTLFLQITIKGTQSRKLTSHRTGRIALLHKRSHPSTHMIPLGFLGRNSALQLHKIVSELRQVMCI